MEGQGQSQVDQLGWGGVEWSPGQKHMGLDLAGSWKDGEEENGLLPMDCTVRNQGR